MYAEPIISEPISKSLRQWWVRERSVRSRSQAAGRLAGLAWEFVRESMPDRRRQRYGDVDFDWERRVDTTAATVSWRTRLLGLLHSGYQPVEPELFREIMGTLAIDFSQFTFIDIGSGKGRALLLAAEYPFRRIIGIELLPELDLIARQNIAKIAQTPAALSNAAQSNIETVCGNAVDCSFPNEPLLVFFFNPLPEAELKATLANLERSVREHPREVLVVYANPVLAGVFQGCRWLERWGGTHQYLVFRGTKLQA